MKADPAVGLTGESDGKTRSPSCSSVGVKDRARRPPTRRDEYRMAFLGSGCVMPRSQVFRTHNMIGLLRQKTLGYRICPNDAQERAWTRECAFERRNVI